MNKRSEINKLADNIWEQFQEELGIEYGRPNVLLTRRSFNNNIERKIEELRFSKNRSKYGKLKQSHNSLGVLAIFRRIYVISLALIL